MIIQRDGLRSDAIGQYLVLSLGKLPESSVDTPKDRGPEARAVALNLLLFSHSNSGKSSNLFVISNNLIGWNRGASGNWHAQDTDYFLMD